MTKAKVKDEEQHLTLEDLINEKTDQAVTDGASSDLVSLIAIKELTDLEKIKVVTRLKAEQVPIMTKLYLYSETFNVPFMKKLADNIAQLQISIGGLGRRELVRVVNQAQPEIMEKQRGLFAKKEVFR